MAGAIDEVVAGHRRVPRLRRVCSIFAASSTIAGHSGL
jgi:hypothetical protein